MAQVQTPQMRRRPVPQLTGDDDYRIGAPPPAVAPGFQLPQMPGMPQLPGMPQAPQQKPGGGSGDGPQAPGIPSIFGQAQQGVIPVDPGEGGGGGAPGDPRPPQPPPPPRSGYNEGNIDPPPDWLTGAGGGYGDGGYGGGSSIFGNWTPPDISSPAEWNDGGMGASIAEALRAVWEGGQTRFSPEVLESMKGALHEATQGKLQRTREAIGGDAVGRGMYRAGSTQAALADAEMGSAGDYTRGVRDIYLQKAQADFQDKMAALAQAEQDLQRQQQAYLQMDMHQIERDRLGAQFQLQMMNLEQARWALQTQFQQQWALNAQQVEGRDYIVINGQRVPLRALEWMQNSGVI